MCPDGYVYNLEVEGTHTYLANGFVVHNCHHTPAKSFLNVVSAFSAKYRYGLTATPYRDDQLEALIFQVMGPTLATVDRQVLRRLGYLITPTVVQRPTSFYFPFSGASRKYGYAALQRALGNDVDRNWTIVADVLVEATSKRNVCIVLVGQIEHGQNLYDALSLLLPDVGFVHSKLPSKQSDAILSAFESGAYQVLVATYRMLAEGFDYPPASRLFLTAPYKGRTLIEQACGRVERVAPGKEEAVIFDYVDRLVGVLSNQAGVRQDVYDALQTPVVPMSWLDDNENPV